MLKKLYELDYFDYKKFILDNTKKLSLSCDEAMVLIKVLGQFKNSPQLSIDNLAVDLMIARDKLELALSSLLERGFYEIFISYDDGLGEESISLDGFFNKASTIINDSNSVNSDSLHSIMQFIISKINRILTSQEIEIISSCVINDHYSIEDFEKAIKKLEDKKKFISIKTIVQELGNKNEQEITKKNTLLNEFFNNIK
ncbi:MAG: hypothetical protein ACI35S_01970 [Anaeroplasma sp.]